MIEMNRSGQCKRRHVGMVFRGVAVFEAVSVTRPKETIKVSDTLGSSSLSQ